jgi:hypothetical protein
MTCEGPFFALEHAGTNDGEQEHSSDQASGRLTPEVFCALLSCWRMPLVWLAVLATLLHNLTLQ